MELRIIGCHGGETPRHRTSAFVLDDRLTIDAGSLTSGLELRAQCALEACLVSHAHLDHIRDLATIADNRAQNGSGTLTVAGTKQTIAILKKHFFNDLLWPDFARIPTIENPTIRYRVMRPEETVEIVPGYRARAVLVSHTIECCAFIVQGPSGSIAYSGDTGPTERLWTLLNEVDDLRAMLLEVSLPNARQELATVSGHHTPRTLGVDLRKFRDAKELPVLLYHIKPSFQAEVERECAKLRGFNLSVGQIGDQFVF